MEQQNKSIDVCGLGNALVDILVHVDDRFLNDRGLKKGSMTLADPVSQADLILALAEHPQTLAGGGSVANSIAALAQLGGKGALIGALGDDDFGRFYRADFIELGVPLGVPLLDGETSGTCVSLITPDAERTMRTCLAVSGALSAHHVDEALIARSKWLFIEGYLYANPETGQEAVRRAVKCAKANGTRIAVTCSDAWVVDAFREPLQETLAMADLLFANEGEACALAECSSLSGAMPVLAGMVPQLAVTAGPRGAVLHHQGETRRVPAFSCNPIDLTGAGDMFAGAYLFGMVTGCSVTGSASGACCLAAEVISQIGARLRGDARAGWEKGRRAARE